jgi:hypothetical protein
MTAEEIAASKARQKKVARDTKHGALGVIWRIVRPDYDPAIRPTPAGVEEILRQFEKPAAQVAA